MLFLVSSQVFTFGILEESLSLIPIFIILTFLTKSLFNYKLLFTIVSKEMDFTLNSTNLVWVIIPSVSDSEIFFSIIDEFLDHPV